MALRGPHDATPESIQRNAERVLALTVQVADYETALMEIRKVLLEHEQTKLDACGSWRNWIDSIARDALMKWTGK